MDDETAEIELVRSGRSPHQLERFLGNDLPRAVGAES